MHWSKHWAGQEEFYEHLATTGRLAQSDRRPAVLRWLWLFRAFRELSTTRAIGMGVGPIPIGAVHAYIDRYGLPEWAVDALLRIDAHWLKVNADGN